MDRMILNKHHETEVNDGKIFTVGGGASILNMATADDTLYGFYTMRDIEVVAVEAIVVEAIMCATTPGVASLMFDTTTVATIAEIDNNAADTNMPGIVVAGKIPAGKMVFLKTTTAGLEGGSETGTIFAHIEYR